MYQSVQESEELEQNDLEKMPIYDESPQLLFGLHCQYQNLIHDDDDDDDGNGDCDNKPQVSVNLNNNNGFKNVENKDESMVILNDDDKDDDLSFNSFWQCTPTAPPSWPSSYKKSVALLIRHAPTQLAEMNIYDQLFSKQNFKIVAGSPDFRRKPTMGGPFHGTRLTRGMSDDPSLRSDKYAFVKNIRSPSLLSLEDGLESHHQIPLFRHSDNVSKNIRDQYSNWRQTAARYKNKHSMHKRMNDFELTSSRSRYGSQETLNETQQRDFLPLSLAINNGVNNPKTNNLLRMDNDGVPLPLVSSESHLINQLTHSPAPSLKTVFTLPIREDSTKDLVHDIHDDNDGDDCVVASDGSTLTQTVMNGLNAMFGLGMLSMPFIMQEIGLIFLPLLILVLLSSIHTLDLLDQCQARTCSLAFPDVATAAFGSTGRFIAGVLCYFDLYASGVGCMIITAHSLNMVVLAITGSALNDSLTKIITSVACNTIHSLFSQIFFMSSIHHCLIHIVADCFISHVRLLLTVIPTCFLKDLSFVSYLSMGGLVANVITVLVVMYFVGLVSYSHDLHSYNNEANDSRVDGISEWIGSFPGKYEENMKIIGPKPFIPFSLLLYQYTMHSFYPSLRASMAMPSQAPTVSRIVLITITFIVIIFSGFIYLILGSNIPELITTAVASNDILSFIVNITVMLNAYSRFPLTLFPICDALVELMPIKFDDNDNDEKKNKKHVNDKQPHQEDEEKNNIAQTKDEIVSQVIENNKNINASKRMLLTRLFALVITLLTCVFIVGFAAIIGFCAWIFTPSLVYAIPILCYIRIFHEDVIHWRLQCYKAVVVVSVIVSVVGTLINACYLH